MTLIPTAFDEDNAALGKPADMSNEQCEALSVCITNTDEGLPVVVSCWKPTAEELEEINRTGRVWLVVFGTTMPPVTLMGNKPFGG